MLCKTGAGADSSHPDAVLPSLEHAAYHTAQLQMAVMYRSVCAYEFVHTHGAVTTPAVVRFISVAEQLLPAAAAATAAC